MMFALARAMKASTTRTRRSVQMASLLKPRLCQEWVRSTTQRAVFCTGAGIPLVVPRVTPEEEERILARADELNARIAALLNEADCDR